MIRFSYVVLMAMALAASNATAAQKTAAASNGWIKAPAAGDTTATAFVLIENPTAYDVVIVSAESDVAGKVQLQRAGKTPDAQPETLKWLTVDAYGSVAMKADGVQLLLVDLKRPLKLDETITLTLSTDAGFALEVEAVVRRQ